MIHEGSQIRAWDGQGPIQPMGYGGLTNPRPEFFLKEVSSMYDVYVLDPSGEPVLEESTMDHDYLTLVLENLESQEIPFLLMGW